MNPSETGIYLLANDRVLDWATAFLHSFRRHNPHHALWVIPFDDQTQRLSQWADKYQFQFVDDASLAPLDEVGRRFFPDHPRLQFTFRKFVMFWGPLKRFLYLDADIVVLQDLTPMLRAVEGCGDDLLAVSDPVANIYADADLRHRLVTQGGALPFNAGHWGARRGLLTLNDVKQLAEDVLPIKDQLCQTCMEQPFLNYCVHTRGILCRPFHEAVVGMPHGLFAIRTDLGEDESGLMVAGADSPDRGMHLPLLHWAGCQKPGWNMPWREVFLRHRFAEMSIPARMRYRASLWRLAMMYETLPGKRLVRVARRVGVPL